MISTNIDLGQLLIAGLIGIVGYLVKRTIDKFDARIDRHEQILFDLTGNVQKLIGMSQSQSNWNFENTPSKKP